MNPIPDAMDRMIDLQLERHAWISRAAARIEQWQREDAEAGMPWEAIQRAECAQSREAGSAQQAPAHDQ
jgi:dsDNA-binding SOS-regulon protein